jgi:ubiquitin-conjugating enzyme E2 variant
VPPQPRLPPRLAARTTKPSAGFRALDLGSTTLCAALAVAVLRELVAGWGKAPPSALTVALALVGGYLAADLASGIVHFLADTIGSSSTPVLGRKFIAPFRTHHERPVEITEHDFLETNGDSCLVAAMVLLATVLGTHADRGGAEAAWALFGLVLAGMVVLTTQFHKWAHAARAPRFARWLQRAGLILPPEEHAGHHEPPFNRRYCITSGILNPLLDGTGILRACQRLWSAPRARGSQGSNVP